MFTGTIVVDVDPFDGITLKVSSLQMTSSIAKISGVGNIVMVKVCVVPAQPSKYGVKVYTKSSARFDAFVIVSPKIGSETPIGPALVVYPLKFEPAEVTVHSYVIEVEGSVGELT